MLGTFTRFCVYEHTDGLYLCIYKRVGHHEVILIQIDERMHIRNFYLREIRDMLF